MSEAERLADILDGMANGQPWRLSQQKDYGEAAILIRAQSSRIAGLEEKNAHLEWLLEGRDSFIVNKGLFPEFVDGLPRGSKALGKGSE